MLTKTSSKLILVTITASIALASGYFIISGNKAGLVDQIKSGSQETAVMYKSPSCGCCVGYSGFLKKDDYSVEIIPTADMNSIKQEHNIPTNMQSCHTTIVRNYFVEGHIPVEAVDKLLAEKPDLDGIALPGMPPGSPGMPGLKTEDFVIYGLKDGQVSEFMRI